MATMQDGVNDAADEAGATVTVQAATCEGDAEEQSTLLQTLIGNDNACFAVAPITGTNLVQSLTVAQEAGRPIVNLYSTTDAEAAEAAGIGIATFIASNNEDAGAQAGTYMAQQLDGSGEVAVVGGITGHANSNARAGGFIEAAEAGGLTVVQEDRRELGPEGGPERGRQHPRRQRECHRVDRRHRGRSQRRGRERIAGLAGRDCRLGRHPRDLQRLLWVGTAHLGCAAGDHLNVKPWPSPGRSPGARSL